MPFQSVDDELRSRFFDWETMGRGWLVWEAPVHLEPPFYPFPGYHVSRPRVPDDGRRPTVLSRVRDILTTDLSFNRTTVEAEPEEERYLEAIPLGSDHPLRSFVLHIPWERKIAADVMASCLLALYPARYPISFELVGGDDQVAAQIVVREPDERLLHAVLGTYFPDITAVPGDLLLLKFARNSYDVSEVFEIGLRREFMLPIGSFRSFDPDPFVALVAALEGTGHEDVAAVQVLFEPTRSPWAASIIRSVTNDAGEDFFYDAPELARLGKQKALQPLFAAALRIMVAGQDHARGQERLTRVATAVAQLEDPSGNQFFNLAHDDSYDRHIDLLRRQSHRSGMLLGLDELTSLVHLPSASVRSHALIGRASRRSRALPSPDSSGIYLGVNRHAGTERPVYLSFERLGRHVHIVGASGSGKSNLLLQLLLDDARQGGGIALLDPHGDLVDDLMARLPAARYKDVVLFDPSDEGWPIGMNVLQAHSEIERTLLASDLVAIFRRLSTSWGDQMHAILAQAIQTLLESNAGGTIADLRRFLVDTEFRRAFLASVEDEETIFYWTKQFPLLKGRPESPILTRLDAFLRPRLIRNIVTQKDSSLDFRRVMDEGKIFLAKLAQGAIGEENAALLGSFLVAKFHQIALSRQDTAREKRRTFLLAIDEFQHFVTPSMASLLTGARKFALGLALSHQGLHQLQSRDGEVYHAVLENAGTRISFRVSDHDAKQLAEGFSNFDVDDLRKLAVGEAICRFGGADHDFNLSVPLMEPLEDAEASARRERIRDLSRATYARKLDREPMMEGPSEPGTPPEPPPEPPPPPIPPATPKPRPPVAPRAAAPVERTVKPLGRGGPQHKYLQSLIKQIGEAHGFRATVEHPLPNHESVDVLLERDSYRIACEISIASTADYEFENVQKCLAAGFEEVILVAPDEKKLRKLETTLADRLAMGDRKRVAFLTPEALLSRLAALSRSPEQTTVGGYNVRVSYRRQSTSAETERKRTVASVLAKSLGKLADE